MKIIAISDTHGRHNELELPQGDVLIHAGDSCVFGTIEEFYNFIIWFDKQPHEHKIIVPGNHDRCLEPLLDGAPHSEKNFFNEIKKKGLISGENLYYLRDRSLLLSKDGQAIKFFGSPWQPFFRNWAFQRHRGKDMAQKWANIPQDTDVLITHGPPYGHGDLAPAYNISKYPRHAGCLELLKRILEVQPKIHIFGHIHAGHGRTQSDEVDTVFFNVANCTEQPGSRLNKPQVIDLASP